MAERNDAFIRNTEFTDANGHLITEVDKQELTKDELEKAKEVTVQVGDESVVEVSKETIFGLSDKKGFYIHPQAFTK